ncbi:peptidase S8/S53 domain-containing protein [Trichoderma sp. SZMC 28014]
MYNTGSSDNIYQLYASIEQFDGDIDRLIDNWDSLYPAVKSQLETADELNLMNRFADILLENGKFDLATSVDESIQEILESDAENELDERNRHHFYSLITGRWSGQESSPTATIYSGSKQSQAGLWQTLLNNKTHKFMYGKDEQFFGTNGIGGPAYEPVKIAVLDSDISPEHLKPLRIRIKARENFAGGQQNAADTDHGTTVAELVLKACPTAHVYIGQVTKLNASGESAVDAEAAAKAIEHAADPTGWGVDIITMSFGWTHINKRIGEALSLAKRHNVLMFASTTNYGFAETNSILYPGRAQEVICVDAAEATGQLAGFAIEDISQGRIERFSAPGLGISSAISDESMDGSSFACPLAAGVAALVLEFSRQYPLCGSKSVQEAVKQREGMVRILRRMSKLSFSSPSRFLCPWELLSDDDGVYGGDGQPGSARYFVAYLFVCVLRQEFGSDVGKEIFP